MPQQEELACTNASAPAGPPFDLAPADLAVFSGAFSLVNFGVPRATPFLWLGEHEKSNLLMNNSLSHSTTN